MAQTTRKPGRKRAPVSPLARWLSIVGIGEDGVAGLNDAAHAAITSARLVVGSLRQLTLVTDLINRERMIWPSPLTEAIPLILARRGQATTVLASGDPFFHGIGATLAEHLRPHEYSCLPAPSSVSLAAARLGWALQETALVSLHGHPIEEIIPHLQPNARILALSWDGTTPEQLAKILNERGLGRSRLHVMEALGGPRERIRATSAETFKFDVVNPLNLIGIEVEADSASRLIALSAGLPDELFENDGQLTKREIRALTLAQLSPMAGGLLWDVGAGAGSIAIEWLLRHRSCRAIAIEARHDRAERIARNAAALGVPQLQIERGNAPEALKELPAPSAIFIGGGASDSNVFEACWAALRPGGRLVVNGVSLETQGLLQTWFSVHGGELRRLMVERAEPLGMLTGWRPAMAVMQWSVVKP